MNCNLFILLNNRFGSKNSQQQLSAWLRPYIHTYNSFGEAALSLSKFFKVHSNNKLTNSDNLNNNNNNNNTNSFKSTTKANSNSSSVKTSTAKTTTRGTVQKPTKQTTTGKTALESNNDPQITMVKFLSLSITESI